jgi:hypothetical protein
MYCNVVLEAFVRMSFRNVSLSLSTRLSIFNYASIPFYMCLAQFHFKQELNDFGFNWLIGDIFILMEFSSGQCQLQHENRITCSNFYQ